MKIELSPQLNTDNGWSQILPARTPTASIAAHVDADWLVVGAGYAGLAAARRLAENRPDDHIVVLEAGVCGDNASGQNSGFAVDVQPSGSQEPAILKANAAHMRVSRAGIACLEELVKKFAIECNWRRDGKYEAAVTDGGCKVVLKPFAKTLEALGEDYRWVEGDELHARLGTAYFKYGVYTPGCILMNPAALIRGLADSLPDNVSLYEHSAVNSIDYDSGVTATTRNGSVKAARMILAANGYSDQFGFAQRKFMHFATYASLTRPLNADELQTFGVSEPWGLTPINSLGGTTLRFTPDHRFVLRQQVDLNMSRSLKPSRQQSVAAHHKRLFDARFPALKNVEMTHTWTGFICLSRNGVPAWGQVSPSVWLAACHNGLGVATATAGGTLVADMATARDNPLTQDMALLGEPGDLPRMFKEIGARAKMAWHRWYGRLET